MAKNTGSGSRKGAVTGRTQVSNPVTKQWVERDEEKGSAKKGEFKNVKEDGKPFKGVAKEPDKRRRKA
jgi:transposase